MGNKIVITGATSEIGAAICEKIIHPDDEVILQGFKNTDNCNMFKDHCRKLIICPVDFSSKEETQNFINEIKDTDILINAAGLIFAGVLPDLEETMIQKMLNINIIPVISTCKAVIPGMLAKRKGVIVNISSITASKGNRGQSVYAGTKGFIESFSRAIASEYGSKGIRINCVAPGAINAGSLKSVLKYAPDEIKGNIAAARLGTAADVASAVEFLCSDGAAYINGTVIKVDGGFMKGI